jgi:2-polyprenyl-3-methyl-5-hydroxy-6-metoxy-1,4-benzoquinol methylase
MIDVNQCPICQGTNFSPHLTCTDHSVSHETFAIVKCNTCELLITNPQPAYNELEKYYLSQAYASHINQGKSLLDKVYLLARTFTLKWKLSLLEKNHSKQNGTILDFGCGVGEFLNVANKHGWITTGVEPSQLARMNADPRVSQNIVPSLEHIPIQSKRFDVITAWHVLEHVSDLNNTIEILKQLLTDNGTIFIAVPNHNSWDARHYKSYWAAYDVPRHLWHFNIHSMTRLLSAHSLTVDNIIPMRLDAFYVSLLSETYKGGTFAPNRLAKTVVNGFRSNHSARKNLGFSSLIYIVKQ